MRTKRVPATATTDLVGAAAVFSVLAVVAMWVSNRGIQDLSRGWTGATSLGRLTGLVSADLMLIQVLLMARLPWVERGFGQDRLARWHRYVGFVSFSLLLAHIVLVTLGYACSVSGFPGELWNLTINAPGMVLAAAAAVLLAGVVVTSVKKARRRLRYESWHLLHLYAYLGVGLAVPHQLQTGTEFTASPVARAYWWTLYIAAVVAILVFRLGVPIARSYHHRLEVSKIVPEGPGVVSVHLRGRRLDRLPARAGQFFVWRFLGGPGWTRGHPYSLSAMPRGDSLRITVKNLGDGSAQVAALRPGTRVLFEGPFGVLTGKHYRGGKVTMIACGVGVAPMIGLLEEIPYPDHAATLVYRVRSDSEILFRDELLLLSERRGVRVIYVVGSRGDNGSWLPDREKQRSDVHVLNQFVPDLRQHDVFICGPDSWASAVRTTAMRLSVPASHIHSERFGW